MATQLFKPPLAIKGVKKIKETLAVTQVCDATGTVIFVTNDEAIAEQLITIVNEAETTIPALFS